jgi:GDP/UDP-N,N'-diacetylbacillosamine 2-epimerase (hydrolysing)
MRYVCYVTGTRADFGLMASTLHRMSRDTRFKLGLLVTGMHLSSLYGQTVKEIRAAQLPVVAEIAVAVDEPSGASMARGIATMLDGFTHVLTREKPDLVLLLGDRGEMLAAAIAAIHLGIPIAHIHGGERSGSVDEPVRHAISKLSHLHLVATSAARERLLRLGERSDRVWVTGAPGLDGITQLATLDRYTLCGEVGFDPQRSVALGVYHPVVNDLTSPAVQVATLLRAAQACNCQVLMLEPNSDAGASEIRDVLQGLAGARDVVIRKHLPRDQFVSWMAQCDVMIGNSSSGIIEAASFGTPVVNVGIRQNLRESGGNVVTVSAEYAAISEAIASALRASRLPAINIYGDGRAGERIVELLATISLGQDLLAKYNEY